MHGAGYVGPSDAGASDHPRLHSSVVASSMGRRRREPGTRVAPPPGGSGQRGGEGGIKMRLPPGGDEGSFSWLRGNRRVTGYRSQHAEAPVLASARVFCLTEV